MLIQHAKIITFEKENRILEGYSLYLSGGLIQDIGPDSEMAGKYHQVERLDARGQYVLPGNICAHTLG
jgi:cytosine/adenosine deaminase-related metal-dependent hydrolase